MMNWMQVLAEQERHKELLQEAERWRMVRLAQEAEPQLPGLAGRLLSGLGRGLVRMGHNLETRYGGAQESASLPLSDCLG